MDFSDTIRQLAEDNWKSWQEILEAYIQSGGNLNHQINRGWTLLHNAVEFQNVEAIRWLVKKGADINLPESRGWTPLHLAVDSDIHQTLPGQNLTLDTTTALIELGADQSLKNDKGQTPCDIATHYGKKTLALYDSIVKRSQAQDDEPKAPFWKRLFRKGSL
jgi:ankyrin repeat protein